MPENPYGTQAATNCSQLSETDLNEKDFEDFPRPLCPAGKQLSSTSYSPVAVSFLPILGSE